jgi:hypothetical protein
MTVRQCTRCGLMLLLAVAWSCQGEVPVAVNEESSKTPIAKDSPQSPASDSGFEALEFADFTPFVSQPDGAEPTWSVADSGVIQTTGTPRGYLYTNKTYDNFTLQGEFRFIPRQEPIDPAERDKYNTGFLIYVPDEHKLWPRSLEVQGRFDLMGQVKSNARDVTIQATDDEAAREEARKPIGEWNTIEITSKDGAVAAFLNGTKISESEAGELKSGHIGLQAEDYAVEFRHLRLREE